MIEDKLRDTLGGKPSKEHPPRTLQETTSGLVTGLVGLVDGLLSP
ncbi:hypothetical protein [Nocardioides sp. TF02-7]|nr:hypothetical protein [Nocardioides sp. TF02-7]